MKKIAILFIIVIMLSSCSQYSQELYTQYLSTQQDMWREGPPTIVELPDGTRIKDPRGIPHLTPPPKQNQWWMPLLWMGISAASQAYIAHESGKTSRAWTQVVAAGISGGGMGYITNSYNQNQGDGGLTTGQTSMTTHDGRYVGGDGIWGNNSGTAGGDLIPGGQYNYPPEVVETPGPVQVVNPEVIQVPGAVQVVRPEIVNPQVVNPEIVNPQVIQCTP